NVEAHVAHVREELLDVAEGPVAPRLRRRRPGEDLVPGAVPRALAVHHDGELAVEPGGEAPVRVARHEPLQLAIERDLLGGRARADWILGRVPLRPGPHAGPGARRRGGRAYPRLRGPCAPLLAGGASVPRGASPAAAGRAVAVRVVRPRSLPRPLAGPVASLPAGVRGSPQRGRELLEAASIGARGAARGLLDEPRADAQLLLHLLSGRETLLEIVPPRLEVVHPGDRADQVATELLGDE